MFLEQVPVLICILKIRQVLKQESSSHRTEKEIFDVPGYGPAEVTVLDCSNPMVFIKASDLGIKGTELVELNQNADVMEHIERIRGMAAVKCGFVENGKMPERNLLLHQRYPLYQRLRITQIWTKIK